MSSAEFRDRGYLQEVNRCFFHPLGLAVGIDLGQEEATLVVFDSRDDPEGVVFVQPDPEKRKMIQDEAQSRMQVRKALLGFVVQPVENPGDTG